MNSIKNIIFDYGNVIFAIDFKIAQQSFIDLGIDRVEDFFAHKGHHSIFDDLETGKLSPEAFRKEFKIIAQKPELTDQQIDDAWNSLLIGTIQKNHDALLKVKEKYRIFLLSNNNEIHYNWILAHLKKEFNIENYDGFFERAYFSHQMKLRKPNLEIFEQVIIENQLDPAETLFIDDSPQHLAGAKSAGLQTLLMNVHSDLLEDFLKEHHII